MAGHMKVIYLLLYQAHNHLLQHLLFSCEGALVKLAARQGDAVVCRMNFNAQVCANVLRCLVTILRLTNLIMTAKVMMNMMMFEFPFPLD